MADCQEAIYSNEYADYMIELPEDLEEIQRLYGEVCKEEVEGTLRVIQIPRGAEVPRLRTIYRAFPKCYALLDSSHLESIGVGRLRRQPYLNLYGQGIIIGILDTGIDYTHPAFRFEDGTSRILALWDQTIPHTGEQEQPAYATVYTRAQLTEAIRSERPFQAVPSRDEEGHGTFLAGVAAGNQIEREDFSGVAPLADLAVVKLKEAKEYLRSFYRVPANVPCYQETDLLLGIRFLSRLAEQANKPLVILSALGTNLGGHEGGSYLGGVLRNMQSQPGRCVCLAAGNETGRGHHYRGYMSEQETEQELELRVGEGENGFVIEFWCEVTDTYSLGLVTPTGYETGRIPYRLGRTEQVRFPLEPTQIELTYGISSRFRGESVTVLRFTDPIPGIWRIRVYREEVLDGRYDLWLPVTGFITPETTFIRADPDTTICEPGNAAETITTAAYNHRNGSIYLHSSRGYTRTGRIKPDITAPGVSVSGPAVGGGYEMRSGTSVAAAQTAGAAALILEYIPILSGFEIQQVMIRGASRNQGSFPNREWGYGILDVFRTLELLSFSV